MENKEENRAVKRIEKRLDKLTRRMEDTNLCGFLDYSSSRSRVLWSNIIQRIAVTLGILTGNAVVIAIILFFAGKAARSTVSQLAQYIADLIELVRVHHPE
jgi:hypothetical protein